MKLHQIIFGIVPCLGLALSGQAQMVTTLDWQFSVAGNPAAPTPAGTVNPSGATASLFFTGGVRQYVFGSDESGIYGSPTGIWSLQDGHLELGVNRIAPLPVDFTLILTQFISNDGFIPGTVSFSLPGSIFDGRVTTIQTSGAMTGFWVEDTYHWTDLSLLDPLSLNITSTADSKLLYIDELKFTVVGTLVPVPEPSVTQLAAAGALALALHFARRKATRVSA